ncbi:MAG: hypothetical protein ACLQGP_20445 [Isosphaeraceae bacterium]
MSRRRNTNGWGARLRSRVGLIGALAAGVAWCVLSGVRSPESLLVPGILSLAMVGAVVVSSRVRARERWEAAWDAYAAQEGSRAAIGPYEDEGMLSMAMTR